MIEMIEVPQQNRKLTNTELAKMYGRTPRTITRHLKELGLIKPREQYEKDALERRRIAYELRQTGLKWREVAEKMGISEANAKMLGQRYKQKLKETA